MRRLLLRSPPRMRGKGVVQRQIALVVGITPACAGKRHPVKSGHGAQRDHPRVCGEKPSSNCCLLITSGSPPRMRGKGSRKTHFQPHLGITPAYAGKSRRDRLDYYVPQGSPPRMRGKGRTKEVLLYDRGITPAYAGKRSAQAFFRKLSWDHPRVCGEKTTTWM